jgi:hypothetical protein
MNNIQYFDIEVTTNEKRNIKGLELENKIKRMLNDKYLLFKVIEIVISKDGDWSGH